GALLSFVAEQIDVLPDSFDDYLAADRNRLHIDVERYHSVVAVRLTTGDDYARILLPGSLDCQTQLGTHIRTRHGEQVVSRQTRRQVQVAVGRSQRIQALVAVVDQYRCRRVILHQIG